MYPQSHEYTSIYGAFYDCGFHQTVTSPTRLNNVLDLDLVNDPLIVNKHTVTCPLGNSDHKKVEFELIAAIPRQADDNAIIPTVKHDFTKANRSVLRERLNATDWNCIFSGSVPVDDIWCLFENILWQAIESTVPIKPVR